MLKAIPRGAMASAVLLAVAVAFSAAAVAAVPKGGGTYTNHGKGLRGTLTVARHGTSIRTMTLEYPIPFCTTGGFSRLTRLPATDIKITKSGAFTESATVENGGQDDPSAPAKTIVSGKFIAGGRKADVAIKLVIDYPAGHQGCSTETIENHGTFTLHRS